MSDGRRRQFTILRRPQTTTATGGRTGPYTIVGRLWGRVYEMSERERYLGGGMQSSATLRLIVRRTKKITAKDRIRYRESDYEVVSVRDVDQTGRELEILAKLSERRVPS